ncbi:MAG: polysaccharide deacetylase family protein [Solirubrobacterales bacterium]|nr:polysaccharide deacetylase family protein [Solirubrobacterales bacterium]
MLSDSKRLRRISLCVVVALLALGLPVVASAATAAPTRTMTTPTPPHPPFSPPPSQPAPKGLEKVTQTSLVQHIQHVTWTVSTAGGLQPAKLQAQGRRICERWLKQTGKGQGGQVCLGGPEPGKSAARLFYSSSWNGPLKPITATVTRLGPDQVKAAFPPNQAGISYAKPVRSQVISAEVPIAKCEASQPAQNCQQTTAFTTTAMHVPVPVGCKATGAPFVTNGPTNKREVALTFDDGPWGAPPSMDFVNELAKLHVPGTFFEIGDQLNTYDRSGAIERAMLADGDMIGDHTWTHPDMTKLSAAQQTSQLESTANAIKQKTGGFTPCLFRAPYGAVDRSLENTARSLNFTTIQWNVDTRDWSTPGTPSIVNTAVNDSRNGSIIIQHFGGGPRYQTLAALPQEVAQLHKKGYQFVTVNQMLGDPTIYR